MVHITKILKKKKEIYLLTFRPLGNREIQEQG